jgi:uncharacterized protein (DUF433 family)
MSNRPVVTVDPAVRFGRPAIKGISTDAIAGMVRAGEDFASVAEDYGLSVHEVIVACWYEGTYGRRRAAWRSWARSVAAALGGHEPLDLGTISEPPAKRTYRNAAKRRAGLRAVANEDRSYRRSPADNRTDALIEPA